MPDAAAKARAKDSLRAFAKLTLVEGKLLVFELDRAAEPMRAVLQKAREQALNQPQPPRRSGDDTGPVGGDDTFLK